MKLDCYIGTVMLPEIGSGKGVISWDVLVCCPVVSVQNLSQPSLNLQINVSGIQFDVRRIGLGGRFVFAVF